MSGNDKSHLGFFDKKPRKITLAAEGEDLDNAVARARVDKQSARRVKSISNIVQDSVTNRVEPPIGGNVRKVTWDELEKMRVDPGFTSLAQYMNNLICYDDGRPRPIPIRPLVENEMGMYGGQIVVLANNPGDGERTGKIHGYVSEKVQEKLSGFVGQENTEETQKAIVHQVKLSLEPQPDPFPSPKVDEHCNICGATHGRDVPASECRPTGPRLVK